jgi:hypothetical protein
VTADGKKFLIITQSSQKGATLNLIVNWPELLTNSRRD